MAQKTLKREQDIELSQRARRGCVGMKVNSPLRREEREKSRRRRNPPSSKLSFPSVRLLAGRVGGFPALFVSIKCLPQKTRREPGRPCGVQRRVRTDWRALVRRWGRRGTCSRSVPPLRRNKGNLNAGFYFHGQRREKKSSWATAAHMKPRTVKISEAEGVRIERDALFMSGRR